jgi:hypothetical protein
MFRGSDESASTLVAATIAKANAPDTTTSITTGVTFRRRRSRSPSSTQAKIDSVTSTTSVGKKRKSIASSSSVAASFVSALDEMVVDRGRKVKSKPKTQSRHAVENLTSVVELRRPSGKGRSKSRDSKDHLKKFVLQTGALEEKSIHFSGAQSSDATEFDRIKNELEILEKVSGCSLNPVVISQLSV